MKTLGSHHITSLSSNLNTQVLWVSYFQSNLLCSPNRYNHCKTSSLTFFLNWVIRDFLSASAQNTNLFGWLLLLMSPLLRSISITYISPAPLNLFFKSCMQNRAFSLALYMNIKECDSKLHTSNYLIIQELLAFLVCFVKNFPQVSAETQHLFILLKYISQDLSFRYLLIWWALLTYRSEKKTQSPFFLCFFYALSCIILLLCEISNKDPCAKQTLTRTVHELQ